MKSNRSRHVSGVVATLALANAACGTNRPEFEDAEEDHNVSVGDASPSAESTAASTSAESTAAPTMSSTVVPSAQVSGPGVVGQSTTGVGSGATAPDDSGSPAAGSSGGATGSSSQSPTSSPAIGSEDGAGATSTCSSGETLCGDQCVNVQTSNANCGACDLQCNAGELCSRGSCQTSCEAPLVECGSSCVDLTKDTDHCGECNNACPVPTGGAATCDGSCGISCSGTMTACDGACVDTASSATHCGGCTQACATGEVCDQGSCETSCDSPLTACNGACVNVNSNIAHCGECDNRCPVPAGGEAVCNGGACGLECQGLTACQGACVDTQTDEDNCGGCQNPCNGECVGGTCCAPDRAVCNGMCVDLESSSQHCGACGNACPTGEVCESGKCLVECNNGDRCGDDCVDLSSDIQNCMSCGESCSAPPSNGQAVCGTSGCDISCNSGNLRCGDNCCDAAPHNSVNVICGGGTCGLECASSNTHTCNGEDYPCWPNDDVTHCGADCTTCSYPNADAECNSTGCSYECRGEDLNCGTTSAPSCGSWSFESSTTEGWVWGLRGQNPDAALTTVAQHATDGDRSLAIPYKREGMGSDYAVSIEVPLCSQGATYNWQSASINFDVSVSAGLEGNTGSDAGGYIAITGVDNQGNATTLYSGCDFYPRSDGTVTAGLQGSACQPPSGTGTATKLHINLRAFKTWSGTFYIDNIRIVE